MCTALGGSSTNLFSPDGGHIVRTFGFSSHSCYCTTAQSVLCTYLVLRSYKGSWQTVDGKLKSQDPAKRCSQGSKWSRSNLQPRKRKRHMKKHMGPGSPATLLDVVEAVEAPCRFWPKAS